jgi:SRSO17 transposase
MAQELSGSQPMGLLNQLVSETHMKIEQILSLQQGLTDFLRPFRPCFVQQRSFAHLEAYGAGLLADLKRKSIEPIALAAGRDERTLQLFLSHAVWEHDRCRTLLQHRVAARDDAQRIGVQRQWCGELGKNENCVVGQHLLYTDNDPGNPFSCMLASDLFLPESWSQDRRRCRDAGIPDEVVYRPKWRIGIAQLEQAVGNGVRFDWVTCDEEYGRVPQFWLELDRLGLRAVGEVQPIFYAWATPPACHSGRAEHSSKRVDHLVSYSPVFTGQPWVPHTIKVATRGPVVWEVKTALVQLVAQSDPKHQGHSIPTDRRYWLIAARNPKTGEMKYIISNAPASTPIEELLRVMWARWHVEKWFERAQQEAGLGAFEVRTYQSLVRHWLICSLVMLFLTEQTIRLRGEKSGHHLRAGGQRRQPDRLARLEPPAAQPGGPQPNQLLLSVA